MLQNHSSHRDFKHRYYTARKAAPHPICSPTPTAQVVFAPTPEHLSCLAQAEQAAYAAHLIAYNAWEHKPADMEEQARLSASYALWQSARSACLRAKAQRPMLFPHIVA